MINVHRKHLSAAKLVRSAQQNKKYPKTALRLVRLDKMI